MIGIRVDITPNRVRKEKNWLWSGQM